MRCLNFSVPTRVLRPQLAILEPNIMGLKCGSNLSSHTRSSFSRIKLAMRNISENNVFEIYVFEHAITCT